MAKTGSEHLYRCNTIIGEPLSSLNLVLDLDETLLHTFSAPRDSKESDMDSLINFNYFSRPEDCDLRLRHYDIKMIDPVSFRGEGLHDRLWGIRRPHLDEFISFAQNYFSNVSILYLACFLRSNLIT